MFPRTRAALQVFQERLPEFDRKFSTVQSNDDMVSWQKSYKAAEDNVREAFWLDTRDYNSHSVCMVVEIQHLRNLVNGQTV